MRVLILGTLSLVTLVYCGFAFVFHQQTRWAVAAETVDLGSGSDISHPDAALGAVRQAFTSGDYSDAIRPLLERFLMEAPSSYQAALFHTVYRANRLEEPELVRKGFEATIRRFPANGRLHFTYARWLLTLNEDEVADCVPMAVEHLQTAMFLEEELVAQGLVLLQWGGVPPEEWATLIPETLPARRHLLTTLFRSGFRNEARALLELILSTGADGELFREASGWALRWDEPQLALEAARRWREQELAGGGAGLQFVRASLLEARAHMALGDPDSAHDVIRDTLGRLENRPTSSRPARLELLNGAGYAYMESGQMVPARSYFLKARALAPYDAASALGLARACRRLGENREAVEQYRRVLELERHHDEARRELQELLAEPEP